MERVLVTGGAGYIGSTLTWELLDRGHSVTVLDNFRYNQNSLSEHCRRGKFDVIVGDCRDESTVRKVLPSFDTVIHLAAIVGGCACDLEPYDAITTNLEAVVTLLKHLSEDQKFLFPCTNSGYGIGQDGIYCTEESPLNPISLYGKTKVAAEKKVLERENSISLRLATVFGVSRSMRTELLVNNFVLRAVQDNVIPLFEGHYKRNFVHIVDVASAFCYCIENFERMKGQVFNLGLDEANLSKLELCQLIRQFHDFEIVEVPGRDPDQRNYIVSNEKLRRAGFSAKVSVEQGIQELLKLYRFYTISYHGKPYVR
jgi:nucleoside-diphosphate-sugar epimerase